MKKYFFLLSLMVLLGFGCAKQETQEDTETQTVVPTPNEEQKTTETEVKEEVAPPTTEQPKEETETPPKETTTPPEELPTPETKIIEITAKQFEFIPAEIRVKKGDNIILKITSVDVTHGFSIPQFGINATLSPNQTTEVKFTPDKTGTFSFFCSIYCGVGHSGMRGTLVVE